MREKPSEAWERLLDARGLGSYRRLGDAAHISHETARRVVTGRAADARSIRAVADALHVDVELVYELRAEPGPSPQAWEPPASATLLTADEREALARLISVITTGREESGGSERDAAAKTLPPVTTTTSQVIVPGEQEPPRPGATGSPARRRTSRR